MGRAVCVGLSGFGRDGPAVPWTEVYGTPLGFGREGCAAHTYLLAALPLCSDKFIHFRAFVADDLAQYSPMQPNPNPDPNAINIELSEAMAEGEYANLAMIAHSNSEFVIDFIRMMPGLPKAKVKARIVVTPEHARRLLAALAENVERYEQSFGQIKVQHDAPSYPMNFGGAVGEA